MREFEQMEMQFFVRPGTEMEWYNTWKEKRIAWHRALACRWRTTASTTTSNWRTRQRGLRHRVQVPHGLRELEGIHSGTDFDLRSHEQHSGRKQPQYSTPRRTRARAVRGGNSMGLGRMFSPY
ncbi:MAG: hypothetical protein IPP26_10255 [Flavobacteriales bacterium]|nr:hypothetical protein [Flavobacteriales bacterium]